MTCAEELISFTIEDSLVLANDRRRRASSSGWGIQTFQGAVRSRDYSTSFQ